MAVLLTAPLPAIFYLGALLSALFFLSLALPKRRQIGFLYFSSALVPSYLATCLIMILVDNFTYNVLHFGISTTLDLKRIFYVAGLVVVFVLLYREILRRALSLRAKWINKRAALAFTIFVLVSIVVGLVTFPNFRSKAEIAPILKIRPALRPNIFLISGDSLHANECALTGGKPGSTPYLAGLAGDLSVFPNGFSNVNYTSGSLCSVLNGLHPATTQKVSEIHILKGPDCYRHLPGILRSLGYKSIQLGRPFLVNAFLWNMKNAFDIVDDERNEEKIFFNFSGLTGPWLDKGCYFLQVISDRVRERLLHAFGLHKMTGAFIFTDKEKEEALFHFLDSRSGPFFVQLHFVSPLGSGPRGFDQNVASVIEGLKSRGLYKDSLVIVYSDHGHNHTAGVRLPILIKLPSPTKSEITSVDVQNLDIAPTVLDVLRIPIPSWMEGQSLLRPVDPTRLIVSLRIDDTKKVRLKKGSSLSGTSHIVSVLISYYDQRYEYRLHEGKIDESRFDKISSRGQAQPFKDESEVKEYLLKFLASRNYDVSDAKPPRP